MERYLQVKEYSISMLKLETTPPIVVSEELTENNGIPSPHEKEDLNIQDFAKLTQLEKFLEQHYDEDCVVITDLEDEDLQVLDHDYLPVVHFK